MWQSKALGVGRCNPQTTFNSDWVLRNYKTQYIIDALTIDVLPSPVHRVPSSSITSSYLSLLFLLTPVLFTNELPGCSLSSPPISAVSHDSSPRSWSVCSDKKTAPYVSSAVRSITGMDMNADHDFFRFAAKNKKTSQMRENKERFWLRAGHEKAHPRVFFVFFRSELQIRFCLREKSCILTIT